MKTLITALLVLLVAGCMRRSDEPIRISVLGADRYELRNRMLDGRALQDDLRAHSRRFGPSAPVVFSFPKGSTYKHAERPILIVSANGFWNMALSEQGTEEASRFFRHPGDGPPMIDVFLDVSGTNVLRDGIPCELANDIDLGERPKGMFGHRVWISPDSAAPISVLIDLLKVCNSTETVTPFVGHFKELEMELSNNPSHHTTESRAEARLPAAGER